MIHLHGQVQQYISCRVDSRIKRICSAVLTGLFTVYPLLHPLCWDLHDVCCHKVKCKVIVLVLQNPFSLFSWCNYCQVLLACSYNAVVKFSTRYERDKRKKNIRVACNVVMWPFLFVFISSVGHWRLFSSRCQYGVTLQPNYCQTYCLVLIQDTRRAPFCRSSILIWYKWSYSDLDKKKIEKNVIW